MSLANKTNELKRLVQSFESQAAKFHPLTLTLLYLTQELPKVNTIFASPNHVIMLWQYYGAVGTELDRERFVGDLETSELRWGVRGARVSLFGVLEGNGCERFVRMARRAGSLFDNVEAWTIKSKVVEELIATEQLRNPSAQPAAVANNNPLAIWINYLLYHLSLTNPGRERSEKIEPDPFALSLLALERLLAEQTIGKIDRSTRSLSDTYFRVAVSFPGEHRTYVAGVVKELRDQLGPDMVFYDHDYQAQLARPNVDVLVQEIYRKRSSLVVVFLCQDYARKHWCGLEWRAVRDLIKSKRDEQVMFIRLDDADIDGLLTIDGYIDARRYSEVEIAKFVLTRLRDLRVPNEGP